MKKLFVFSDIHSYYDQFIKALNDAGFDVDNQDHILVSLGDLCDRGPDSVKILDFINSFSKKRKICIIGNHELLLEDVLIRGSYLEHDLHNQTDKTINQLTKSSGNKAINKMKDNQMWKDYKKNWRYYFELDKYIFVHGYIPSGTYNKYGELMYVHYVEDWRNCNNDDWLGATWTNGMYAWSMGIVEKGKTIVCGHYHTSWGHSRLHKDGPEFDKQNSKAKFEPFIDKGIIAIDACTAYSGLVNILTLEIEDEEFNKWYK